MEYETPDATSGKGGGTNQLIVLNQILVFMVNVKIHGGMMLDSLKGGGRFLHSCMERNNDICNLGF